MKMLHLRSANSRMPKEGLFIDKLRELGQYDDIPYETSMTEEQMIDLIGQYDALLTIWGNVEIPAALAKRPGQLKYICNVSGTLKEWIPLEITKSPIQVTNWGDAQADGVAEGAMALLFAVMKDIPSYVLNTREDQWGAKECVHGTLDGMRVAIYGMGFIGRRFVEMIKPFNPVLFVYDPYVAELPEGCTRANSLQELFSNADALVVHAGRSVETDYSITADLLALLPDNAIIVNTARGEIFDQDALFNELRTGRLRAGLDVLSMSDRLEKGDPARQWRNCIFTAHSVGGAEWPKHENRLEKMYVVALENLKRFQNGESLQFMMDPVRYTRST